MSTDPSNSTSGGTSSGTSKDPGRGTGRPSDRTQLRSAYLYLVCLVTLVMTIVGLVGAARDAVQLAYPDPGYLAFEVGHGPDGKPVSAQEQRRREEAARESQRRQALLGLIGNGALVLIAGPTYLYHWRRVQDEQKRPTAEGAAPRG